MRFLRRQFTSKRTKPGPPKTQPETNSPKRQQRLLSLAGCVANKDSFQKGQAILLAQADYDSLFAILSSHENDKLIQGRNEVLRIPEIEKVDGRQKVDFDILQINKTTSYLLYKELGRGAFGAVYEAPIRIEKKYRGKCLSSVKLYPALENNEGVIKIQKIGEAKDEIRPAAYFQGVRRLEEINNDFSATVMAKAPGKNLTEINFKKMSFDDCCNIGFQLVNELAAVHSDKSNRRAYIHSDLKPANILYDEKTKKVKIVDWGLCASAHSAEFKGGTLAYMDPAIFSTNGKPTISNDMYALSGILWEVFGADNVLKSKSNCSGTNKQVALTPFCSDGAFSMQLPDDVDPLLIRDMKAFFKSMENPKPECRPLIQPQAGEDQQRVDALSFFSTLLTRRAKNKAFNDEFKLFKGELQSLITLQASIDR